MQDDELQVRTAFAESPGRGFEVLFRLYHQALCSHAVRFVYSKAEAEDIVSEVFYQLWKTGAYRTVRFTFRTYLYAAVRHRACNHLRDELTGTRAPVSVETVELVGRFETPQTLMEYDETFQRVERAIQELPPQCQKVFLLSRFENRKNQEIADELGLAVKTVEAHLSRALHQLRRVFLGVFFLMLIGVR